MAFVRPLLREALTMLKGAGDGPAVGGRGRAMDMLAAHVELGEGAGGGATLPLILQMPPDAPREGETWPDYKARVADRIQAANEALTGGSGTPLYLANAIAASLEPRQIERIGETEVVRSLELDRMVKPTAMDDAALDLDLAGVRGRLGDLRGAGVRVAVLDSGVDVLHPMLSVAQSVSTCGETTDLPGRHGTHCAGSIASRDAIFGGVAPDCTLLNVKVLRQDGTGTSAFITQGVDAALDLDAEILSMSLGFNHLPTWSRDGHGWTCPDGRCELCTAVDNAVFFGAIVCVAAGNEHNRAQALRSFGMADAFDTELGCPGHARGAITVGAITKRTFLPADFSSQGPTAYREPKPDLVGPGVNVMSTTPVPRGVDGALLPDPARHDIFGRESGTSMATPIVAGAAALILEHRRQLGLGVTPAEIRDALLTKAVTSHGLSVMIGGAGGIDLSQYGLPVPTS